MIVNKSKVLLAACNHLQSISLPASQSSTSSRRCTRQQTGCPQQRCEYATIASDAQEPPEQPERSAPEHVWPDPYKGQTHPTPYQILDLKQNATYTKARYYQLVKIYHPDLQSNSGNGISHKIRIERYRLIVAAHNILSDPAKRSAYDRFGAGWNGRAEVGGRDTWAQPSPYHPPGPFSQSWTDPSNPIWQNATWEDWERFRQRNDGVYPEKRAPVYMANSYFLALIVALAVMGSSLNYNRAQDAGTYFVEQRDIVHDKAAKELRRVRQEASTINSKTGRIDYFVRQREATMGDGDYQALREERANRILKDRETCGSEQIRESG